MLPARFLTAFIVSLAAAAVCQAADRPPQRDVPGSSIVKDIPEQTREDFYAKRRDIRRQTAPRVLFVPGILGSKIMECRSDGSQCRDVWGTTSSIAQRDIDLRVKPDRRYRTDVVETVLFNDVYGGIVDHIRRQAISVGSDTFGDPMVSVFSYDWRQSNASNAVLLHDRICEIRTGAEKSPVVIIAHSMGGLMTKIWAARYAKQACSNGKMPSVSEIVFVATPHLGSPKAIKAVIEGYNLLFDELTGLRRLLGWWEKNYLLDAINAAGISFPSLYELLPIRTSEYCMLRKPALGKALVPVDGDDQKPVNLFDVETWRKYDLLQRIGLPAVRNSYYDNNLAPMLKNAEQLLCEIADFDPSSIADVTYYYGREKTDRTYGWFQLRSGKADSIDSSKIIQGDGTVPVYSAQSLLVSSTRQTIEVQADHTSIISSKPVLSMVDDLYISAAKRADLQTARAEPQYASLLAAETAATRAWIAISSDPKNWSSDDDRLAIDINKRAFAAAGTKPSDIAALASNSFDAAERARLYAIAAATTEDNKQQLTWIADAANSSYVAGQYQDAITSSNFITVAAAKALPQNDPTLVALQKSAAEVKGWSYLRSGDLAEFNRLASSYADTFTLAKEDFKEPVQKQNPAVQWVFPGKGQPFMVYGSSNDDAWVAYEPSPAGKLRFYAPMGNPN
jgi:pimeloyl-ACP methyl ester carboxylesterase